MVADTARRGSLADGLQPLNLARDWRQVIALIEMAFGEALDIEARHALRSMQLPPLMAPVIGLLDSFSVPGEGMMPGFVWLENRQVVGSASARRIRPLDRGWLISNVAVHPDRQGRGIGRALLEATVDFAQEHGASWIVLQVRDSNTIAQRLYKSLGFRSIGRVIRLRKPDASSSTRSFLGTGLRPARWSEGGALSHLARALTPRDVLWADLLNQDLFRTGPASRLVNRLKGIRRQWWVLDPSKSTLGLSQSGALWTGSALHAATGIEIEPRFPWHRLRLLIAPQAQDEQLATTLVAFGLAQLKDAPAKPVEIEHPASDQDTQSALAEAGFEAIYTSMHMRLDLK